MYSDPESARMSTGLDGAHSIFEFHDAAAAVDRITALYATSVDKIRAVFTTPARDTALGSPTQRQADERNGPSRPFSEKPEAEPAYSIVP
jgi:hypothetical protein